jgi:hypothetical protein
VPEQVEDAPRVVLSLVARTRDPIVDASGGAPVRGLDEDDAIGAVQDQDGRVLGDRVGLSP